MKLYLSSEGIQPNLKKAFLGLVSKSANDIRFAFITNAADSYPKEKRGFVETVRKQIEETGIKPEGFNLDNFDDVEKLYTTLKNYDVIWCGGGNTWYLRYLVKKTGFDTVIKRLVSEGKVYGGDSAGAILMTPTLKYVDLIDNPNDAPEIIEEGLGLVDFCIVPHWGYKGYEEKLRKMRDNLVNDGFEVKSITDQQAIVIDGENIQVL